MATASAHNGGRTQVNFNFPNDGGDFWAINLLKTAATVKCVNNGAIDPAQLDDDGYPTSLTGSAMSGGVVYSFFRPTGTQRGGATPNRYKLTWTGNGTVDLSAHALTTIAGSATSSGGTGSWTVNITNDTDVLIQLRITAVGSPRITDLKFFHVDDETLLNAGETFGVQFKTKLRESNFGVYRFLNWQGSGNTSNVTTWNTRKPYTHATWAGSQYRAAFSCGDSTGLSGFTYTASAPSLNSSTNAAWSGLVDKCLVHVNMAQAFTTASISGITFANASSNITITGHSYSVNDPIHFTSDDGSLPINFSQYIHYYVKTVVGSVVTVAATAGGTAIVAGSAPTGQTYYADPVLMLNIGGTGPLPMRSAQVSYLSTGGNAYPTISSPSRDTNATFMYDAGLQAWIKFGGDVGYKASGINNGVPVEAMLLLCAEMGAHPYYVSSAAALDPVTDFYPSLAAYNRDNSPSWMVPIYEPPNELWNTGADFWQTGYANNKVQTFGWTSPNYQDFYGKIASVYGQAIAAVYSVVKANVKSQTKYKFGIGVQTIATGASAERFDSTKYVGQAAAAQSGAVAYNYGTYAKDAAKDWATHIITAQYWNPAIVEDPVTEAAMAALYIGGDTSQAQTFLNSATAGTAFFDIPGVLSLHQTWKTFALTKGISKHLGYEGGYYPAFRTANQTAMEIAAKLLPDMKAHTKLNINNFFSLSDGSYTAEYPSQFQFSGNVRAGIVDEWSMYDDIWETAKPMAQAFQELNQTPKFVNLRLRIHG